MKYKLPEPKDNRGYTTKELDSICRSVKVSRKAFNKTFGINTATMDEKGNVLCYKCDIERTLYNLGKQGGKFHLWD